MTRFLNDTIYDMRAGRESWRVFTALGVLAFSLSFALKFA